MAVTVETAWVSGPFMWTTEKDGSHVLKSDSDLYVLLQSKKNEATYKFTFKKGFKCDDIFRGILRESGIGRFKAGAADLAVGIFAGNRNHWGSDSYKVGELVHLSDVAGSIEAKV